MDAATGSARLIPRAGRLGVAEGGGGADVSGFGVKAVPTSRQASGSADSFAAGALVAGVFGESPVADCCGFAASDWAFAQLRGSKESLFMKVPRTIATKRDYSRQKSYNLAFVSGEAVLKDSSTKQRGF
jgi:hypothetical protein